MHKVNKSGYLIQRGMLALCVLLLTGASSCSLFGKKDNQTSTHQKRLIIPPSFEFKFKLEPGADYTGTFLSDRSITVNDPSEALVSPAPVRFDMTMDWHVQEQDEEQADQYIIDMKIADLTLSSEALNAETVARILPAFQNVELVMTVGADGTVKDLYAKESEPSAVQPETAAGEGMQGTTPHLLSGIISTIEGENKRDGEALAIVAALKDQLSRDRLVQTFSLAFNFVPSLEATDADVKSKRKRAPKSLKKKDDTWEKADLPFVVIGPVAVPLKLKYKFAELSKESGAELAQVLFGERKTLSSVALDEGTLSEIAPKRMRAKEMSGVLDKLETRGYVVFNTKNKDFEEMKSTVTGTGSLTVQPRRGDPISSSVEVTQNFVLSVTRKQQDKAAPGPK